MAISGVNNQYPQYYGTTAATARHTDVKNGTEEKTAQGATVEISGSGMEAYSASKKETKDGTVVAKSDDTTSVNKMSKEDRAALVKQLQADQEKQTQSLINMVRSALGQQSQYALASEDSVWKFLASGNFTVDAQTKADAQAAIAEDGYWGVKQTSERLFEFAQALAGDDVEKMEKMQAAIEKGYKMATGTWGKELPSICKDTLDAVNQKFADYYESKNAAE